MCNCITETNERTLAHLRMVMKGKREISGGKPYGAAIMLIGNALVSRTADEFNYDYQPVKKDGTLGKATKASVSLIHTYCPYCGTKYDT